MKRIGWIAMLLCAALVITGCSKSDDENGKPAGDDSAPAAGSATGGGSGTAGESADLGAATEAAAKPTAGKGGKKVAGAVGNALWKSVTGDTDKDDELDKAPEF